MGIYSSKAAQASWDEHGTIKHSDCFHLNDIASDLSLNNSSLMLSHKAQRTTSLKVDKKLSLSHGCSLGAKKVSGIPGCIRKSIPSNGT